MQFKHHMPLLCKGPTKMWLPTQKRHIARFGTRPMKFWTGDENREGKVFELTKTCRGRPFSVASSKLLCGACFRSSVDSAGYVGG